MGLRYDRSIIIILKKGKLKYKSAFKIFKLENVVKVRNEYPQLSQKDRLEVMK